MLATGSCAVKRTNSLITHCHVGPWIEPAAKSMITRATPHAAPSRIHLTSRPLCVRLLPAFSRLRQGKYVVSTPC